MAIVGKVFMFIMAAGDMNKLKEFCVDKLGLKITRDYRIDDAHWWVAVQPPEGGTIISITTHVENMKPGTMRLYLSTPDIKAAHDELARKGAKPTEVSSDLYGPGSGAKWFNVTDPEGNSWIITDSMPPY